MLLRMYAPRKRTNDCAFLNFETDRAGSAEHMFDEIIKGYSEKNASIKIFQCGVMIKK